MRQNPLTSAVESWRDSSVPLWFMTLKQPPVSLLSHSKKLPLPSLDKCRVKCKKTPQKNITATCSWPLRACLWLLMLSAENCPGRSSSSVLVNPGLSTSANSCFKGTVTVGELLPVLEVYTRVQPSSLFELFSFFTFLPLYNISAASTRLKESMVWLKLEGNH